MRLRKRACYTHSIPIIKRAYLWGRHLARHKKGVHSCSSTGRRPNDGRHSPIEVHSVPGDPYAPSPNPCSSYSPHLLVAGPRVRGRAGPLRGGGAVAGRILLLLCGLCLLEPSYGGSRLYLGCLSTSAWSSPSLQTGGRTRTSCMLSPKGMRACSTCDGDCKTSRCMSNATCIHCYRVCTAQCCLHSIRLA